MTTPSSGACEGAPLTILNVITPARYSGAERAAVYLAEKLQERGHRCVFALKRNNLLLDELTARGIEAHVLPISGKLNVMTPFLLGWMAERVGADVIHTHLSTGSLWGSVAGRMTGIPVVASAQAMVVKTCFLLADLITTVSEGVTEHLVAQGVSADRLRLLYVGIFPEDFEGLASPGQVRSELGIAPDAPVIGEVAHLSARKGQRYLIEAIAILRERWPDIICLLVGEGDQRDHLAEFIARSGLERNVRLLGYRHDAVRIMQAMDVVALPSVTIEGLGICLIEAAMLRKPVVGSDAPGVREALADGETGLLVRPKDARDLAEKLEVLLEDRALAARMGEAGRARALKMFTIDCMADTAERVYREVMAGTRRERWLL